MYFQSRDFSDEIVIEEEVNMSGAQKAKVILLACGSYNPITNTHLRMFGKFKV